MWIRAYKNMDGTVQKYGLDCTKILTQSYKNMDNLIYQNIPKE